MMLMLTSCASADVTVILKREKLGRPAPITIPYVKMSTLHYDGEMFYVLTERERAIFVLWLSEVLRYIKDSNAIIQQYEKGSSTKS